MNSIIIPTYCPHPEVVDKLRMCLISLMANTQEPYELIIVEQGDPVYLTLGAGRDNMLGIVEAYVYLPAPVGFARAVNIGVNLAVREHLFIVNSDIVLPKNWDTGLKAAYARRGPWSGIMCPTDQAYPVSETIQDDVGWWSCVLMHRRVWDIVGPLDEKLLPMKFHDQDWNIRCKQEGFSVSRYYGVQVNHDESSTYRHVPFDDNHERAIMRARYGCEHFFEWVAGIRK